VSSAKSSSANSARLTSVRVVTLIGLPTVFAAGSVFSPDQGPLTNETEMGNLIRVLSLAQYAGPWPVGDFRLEPGPDLITAVLVGATVLAAGLGAWVAAKRRAWGLLQALVAGSSQGYWPAETELLALEGQSQGL